ncbi:DUF177 domain-containing protein [candidate division WOR-3 bacterium]|nr:DUF177 domain-containing protein [candidate division WOR-3 bacterium]
MKLQFDIEDLPREGREYEVIFSRDEVHIDEAIDTIKGLIRIKKTGNVYEVKGKLEYNLHLQCSRCLDPFSEKITREFEYEFKRVIKCGNFEKDRGDFDGDYIISNTIIDLKPLFRDLIVFSVPMKPLCREDCKGLCPVCGVNFNKEKCEHVNESSKSKVEIDPRWKKLKELEEIDAST